MNGMNTVNELMKEIKENLDKDILEFWELMDKYEKKGTPTLNETVVTLQQIRLKIDRAKKVRLGSIPTFDEAEKVFHEVVQLYPKGEALRFEVVREKEHEGYIEGMDYEPFHWEKVKTKTTFEDSLSIKSWGSYIIEYDGQTGQTSDFFEGRLKREEVGAEEEKLRNDIDDRLKELFNKKFEKRMRVE